MMRYLESYKQKYAELVRSGPEFIESESPESVELLHQMDIAWDRMTEEQRTAARKWAVENMKKLENENER